MTSSGEASGDVMERDWLPLRLPSQKVLGILSCHEGILFRFTRDFDYKETNLCGIVYNYVLTDKRGLCLLPLHYWNMVSGMCWEGASCVSSAVDCFLCPRICRSQLEGRTQCKYFPGFTDGIELSRVL